MNEDLIDRSKLSLLATAILLAAVVIHPHAVAAGEDLGNLGSPVDVGAGDAPERSQMTLLSSLQKCTYKEACDWCVKNCKDFCAGCLDKTFTCGATSSGACACYCACKICPESNERFMGALEF